MADQKPTEQGPSDEQIVIHHPDLGLQTYASRGAFVAPKSAKCPGGGLKAKGWKLGELPATASTKGS